MKNLCSPVILSDECGRPGDRTRSRRTPILPTHFSPGTFFDGASEFPGATTSLPVGYTESLPAWLIYPLRVAISNCTSGEPTSSGPSRVPLKSRCGTSPGFGPSRPLLWTGGTALECREPTFPEC